MRNLFEIPRPQVLRETGLRLKSQALARLRSLEGMSIFHFHQLYWNSCLPQFVREGLGLRNRHVFVVRAMNNKERRYILANRGDASRQIAAWWA